jgi:hypothetical protein
MMIMEEVAADFFAALRPLKLAAADLKSLGLDGDRLQGPLDLLKVVEVLRRQLPWQHQSSHVANHVPDAKGANQVEAKRDSLGQQILTLASSRIGHGPTEDCCDLKKHFEHLVKCSHGLALLLGQSYGIVKRRSQAPLYSCGLLSDSFLEYGRLRHKECQEAQNPSDETQMLLAKMQWLLQKVPIDMARDVSMPERMLHHCQDVPLEMAREVLCNTQFLKQARMLWFMDMGLDPARRHWRNRRNHDPELFGLMDHDVEWLLHDTELRRFMHVPEVLLMMRDPDFHHIMDDPHWREMIRDHRLRPEAQEGDGRQATPDTGQDGTTRHRMMDPGSADKQIETLILFLARRILDTGSPDEAQSGPAEPAAIVDDATGAAQV